MLPTMSRTIRLVALVAGLAMTGLPAWGQTYPSGPVHLIVAYAAGGTGDVVARIVAPKLSIALGQSVVVENRAGASGAIGARSVAAAAPDGLTLLVGQTAEVAINQHWLKGLNYDPDKDLQPVALLAVVPLALVVPAKAPYSTMAEFLAALKTSQADIRIGRHRHARTFRRRTAQGQDQRQSHPCAVQGRRACVERSDRRPCRSLFSGHAGGDAAAEIRSG